LTGDSDFVDAESPANWQRTYSCGAASDFSLFERSTEFPFHPDAMASHQDTKLFIRKNEATLSGQ
jgi:hypothetical protein